MSGAVEALARGPQGADLMGGAVELMVPRRRRRP